MALARATPWRIDDLRTVMGLETDADAKKVLLLAGCSEAQDGRFGFSSEDEEAAFVGAGGKLTPLCRLKTHPL
jgi:hypothetical protein